MKVNRFRLFVLAVAVLTATSISVAEEGPGAKLLSARAGVSPNSTVLTLEFNGAFTYHPTPSGERLIFVDLPGVLSTQSTESRVLRSGVVSSYRLVPYVHGEQQGARLEVLLKEPAAVSYQEAPGALEVKFQPAAQEPPPSPESVAKVSTPPPPVVVASIPAASVPRVAAIVPRATPLRARGDAIENVTFSREGEAARVRIVSNGPLEFKTLVLSNPSRLVVDIPNATSRAGRDIPVAQAPVKAIRVGQFRRSPRVARVVLELDGEVPYIVNRRNDGLEVEFRPGEKNAQPLTMPEPKRSVALASSDDPKPAALPSAGHVEVPGTPLEPGRVQTLAGRKPEPVLTASLQPPATALPAPGPANSGLQPPAGYLPANTSVSAPASVPAMPAAEPAPVNAAPAVIETNLPPASTSPVVAAPSPAAAPASAEPADHPPLAPLNVAAAAAPRPEPAALQPPTPRQGNPPAPIQAPPVPVPMEGGAQTMGARYSGEPISVNLKDVDLKDFFRLVHEISGLNIVIDPNVSGRVTTVLEEVPWDQALDIVLRNNGMVKQLEGNVLRIATSATAQAEEDAKLKLAETRAASTERVTVMRPLNYAKAAELLPTLSRFLSKPRGEMIADTRTNTLIITDIPQVIPTIDQVLATLDRRTVQVEIEARVVAASRQFSRDIGAQFGFGTTAAGGKTLFTGNLVGSNGSPAQVTGLSNALTALSSAALPLFSNFPAAGAATGMGILHRSPNAAIDLLISAAETKGIGKLLSRPRIITQNNKPGSVKQGVQIPIQTTVNNTISVQFQDVTLSLTVTPQVTNEGTIFLEVRVSNTAIDPGIARINGVPALDTQEANTQVLVQDGGTIVFGGVLQNSNNITIQQVPILGSIPVLGNLFKRTGVNTNTNELLFFLTPRIV